MPQIFDLTEEFNPWYSALKVTFAVFLASFFLSFIEADSVLLKAMSEEISISRENLRSNTGTNNLLSSLNTSTKQGALQGRISGVILALNMISEDEDSNKSSMNPVLVINNATKLLTDSIAEIENVSIRELLD
jgi:hypothetical protein